MFFTCSIPICDFKRQQIDWIVVDGWILGSFQMRDAAFNMLQPNLLPPWSGRNSKYQVKHFDRRLLHREGVTHSFRVAMFYARSSVPLHMQQLRRTWCPEWQLNTHSIKLQVAMHAMLTYCFISEKKASTSTVAARPVAWCVSRSRPRRGWLASCRGRLLSY